MLGKVRWLWLQCFDTVGWVAGRASGLKKTEWWGMDMVICLERVADLHMAQLIPLPLTASCFSKIQIGFTFLVPAHPGSPGQRAVIRFVNTSTDHRCQAQQNILSSRDFRLHCGCATANSPRSLRLPVQRSIYRSMYATKR